MFVIAFKSISYYPVPSRVSTTCNILLLKAKTTKSKTVPECSNIPEHAYKNNMI